MKVAVVGLATVVSLAGTARAAEPAPNAIAVLPLELEGNIPAGRPALETAVARGLSVVSGPTIGAAEVATRLTPAGPKPPCATEACWMAVGKAIAARYLVAGKVERKGPMFEVRFRLIDAPTGRLLASESNRCELADCSIAELCRQTVRELVRQTLGDPTRASMTEPPPTGGPIIDGTSGAGPIVDDPAGPGVNAPILDPSGSADSSLQQTADEPPRGPRLARLPLAVPILAIAVGVVSAGTGAYYVRKDGDCVGAERPCQRLHRTLWGGLGWVGSGVTLVGTGVVLAILRSRAISESETTSATALGMRLSVGPGSAAVSGRF